MLTPAVVTRLEKAAVDNGFDRELSRQGDWLAFASTQVPLQIWLTAAGEDRFVVAVSQQSVARVLADQGAPVTDVLPPGASGALAVADIPALDRLVRRAFQLSKTLPDELLHAFEKAIAALPRTTEIERLVVERVGQQIFRNGLLEYWQGRCAITGLAVPDLLRAGHIKPWAGCDTDAERLDVFNGLLLAPNLDAAFDRGFITVADNGEVLVSERLGDSDRRVLGLDSRLRVSALDEGHEAYLRFHRERVFKDSTSDSVPRDTAPQRPNLSRAGAAPAFGCYIGIDYSGAKTPISSLDGLRVYIASQVSSPVEVQPPPVGQRKHWTRQGVAHWLVERLAEDPATIVGIDHGFSFPLAYFEKHGLARDWPAFLDDFQRHWPTDDDDVWVRDVRNGITGTGDARKGEPTWLRVAEQRARGTKSVFRFGVEGEVATSTHAGLPWLRFIRQQLGQRVHCWPFDGWIVPAARSAAVEVYPSLWRGRFPPENRTNDQHDAFSVAAQLREADRDGTLADSLNPPLTEADRATAQVEGWILGVG